MAMGMILSDGRLVDAYIYEGENIAVEYPDGKTFEVPRNKIHTLTMKATLPDGTSCNVLLEKTPMTRLDIVVLEEAIPTNT